jgi:hypothetical protein
MSDFSFDNFDDLEKELFPQTKSSQKKGDYFSVKKLPPGSYRIRLASIPVVLVKHWDDRIKRSVPCVGKEKGCSYHESLAQSEGKTIEFVSWVIDRSDGKPKIAFLNNPVIKQLATLKKNPEYTYVDIPGYDITIEKIKTGTNTFKGKTYDKIEYKVTAARKDTPLTKEEEDFLKTATTIQAFVDRLKEKAMPVKTAVEALKQADIESVLEEEDIGDPPF